jgi:hypothetical protein
MRQRLPDFFINSFHHWLPMVNEKHRLRCAARTPFLRSFLTLERPIWR